MRIRRVRALLLSTALAAVAGLGAGPLAAETLADALVKAYQTSPLLESSRAALRSLDESIPQARAGRRPQVSAGVDGNIATEVEDVNSELYQLQAALNASLVVFDSGQTKAAIESARNQIAA